MKDSDILIIGGGICGMTAAIYAARANLHVRILEKEVCGGLVNWTHTVENVPSYQSIHGMELMEKCREHVESLHVDIEEVDEVASAELDGDLKKVTTAMGEVYTAKAIIIATGRKPRPFPVKTAFEKIHYCSVCDGTAYKGKDVLVLGGGNSSFDESLYLVSLGVNHIHIVETFPNCIAAETTQLRARQTGKIQISTSTDIRTVDVLPSGKALIHLLDKKTGTELSEEVDGIFCFIGQIPNTNLFEKSLAMDNGYIVVNNDMETNIHGVYAAGDVIVKKYRQITTAMGDGTIAALQAISYLNNK